ncbi:hypothetical protein [Catenovulum adriaticum]|uniref:Cytochrome oxidase Cu insertion factor (SCO1/SenC/PrrC family) n=1 Tax=Catenovulum adriaticum TaxID=2984846 RepID=A0ABY7AMR2_9ALTE|nr:hypothetical protein [Catenovulum sp. TS8]WAJ69946.1 hypothetical protein OLW01_12460 [Catenovulum sp. TS8]
MEETNQLKKRSARFNLSIIFFVFFIPVIAAYIALKGEWFNLSATNQGELITPAMQMDITQLNAGASGKWLMIVPSELDCQKLCQESTYLVKQADIALGRETQRVLPSRYIATNQQLILLDQADPNHKFAGIINPPAKLSKNYVYIADPLGQIILRYPISLKREENLIAAKHLLADLRKLLKLSRVG